MAASASVIEIRNVLGGHLLGTVRATESPCRLDSAPGLALGVLILTGAHPAGATSGTPPGTSLQGLLVAADPGTVVTLLVVQVAAINELATRESRHGLPRWRNEFRSLVGGGVWQTPCPLTRLGETVQERLTVVMVQFWVERWRAALPYTGDRPWGRLPMRTVHGVRDILGRALAAGAPRWPKPPRRQRYDNAVWLSRWVLLQFRSLNAARLRALTSWLDQEPNRYHCFVR